jgi:hypothetical protein
VFFEAFSWFGSTTAAQAISCVGGTVSGNCCYGAISSTPSVGAGVISFHDGATSIGAMDSGSFVESISTPSFKWNVGDTLSVSASGDASGVAPFSGSVVAPPVLSGMSPAFDGGSNRINVSTATDFTVNFTAGSGGANVWIDANTNSNFVNCTAPSSAGKITIPHALLAALNGQGIISMSTYDATRVVVTNATVEIRATNGEMNQYVNFQ